MARTVGIDLGATAIKAVAVEAGFRAHTIRAYRVEPVAPDGPEPKSFAERLKPALEALAQDGFLVADSIICCLPGAQVATHVITLPFGERNKVEATLPNEVEDLVPFKAEEIVFDWHQLSRVPGKTELLVAVAQKRDILAALDALKQVGIDPESVLFSTTALANLYAESYVELPVQEPETPPMLDALVDVGAERTNIAILERGSLKFGRTVAHGGATVTRALARALEVPFEQAEVTKLELAGTGTNDPTLNAVLERSVSGLVRELRATFATYQAQSKRKVDRVLLTGGGSLLTGIDAFIGEALAVPVTPLSLTGKSIFPDSADVPRGTLALALALRGVVGSHGVRIDFRRGELAFTKGVGEMRSLYIRLGAMAATLFILFSFSMWSKLHALEKREAVIDDVLCQTTKKILGKCEPDFRVALSRLQGESSPAAGIPTASALDIVEGLSAVFPPENDAVLSEMDIIDNTVMLRGTAKGFDALENVLTDLKGNKCFAEVRQGKSQLGKDEKVDFDVQASYVCGQPSKRAGS